MNELDYTSLEISKRLAEAGIVLETDALWATSIHGGASQLIHKEDADKLFGQVTIVPAPSMAEVWRELPENITQDETYYYRTLQSRQCYHFASYRDDNDDRLMDQHFMNANPTDALIDLLIWVTKEVRYE